MSKAQKLVNRAIAILQRQHQPNSLTAQNALEEIRTLFDRTKDDGIGTASEQVKLARKIMAEYTAFTISDEQAINELSRIFNVGQNA